MSRSVVEKNGTTAAPAGRRVTLRDVAQAAGVSHQTVSRAINSKGEIDPETGYVVDVSVLKQLADEHVIALLDHRNLNLDVPWFREQLPSADPPPLFAESEQDEEQAGGEARDECLGQALGGLGSLLQGALLRPQLPERILDRRGDEREGRERR